MRKIMEEVEDAGVVDVALVIQDAGARRRLMIMVTKKKNESPVELVVVATNTSLSSRRDTCKKTKKMLS